MQAAFCEFLKLCGLQICKKKLSNVQNYSSISRNSLPDVNTKRGRERDVCILWYKNPKFTISCSVGIEFACINRT